MALCFLFTSSTFSASDSMNPRISSTCGEKRHSMDSDRHVTASEVERRFVEVLGFGWCLDYQRTITPDSCWSFVSVKNSPVITVLSS